MKKARRLPRDGPGSSRFPARQRHRVRRGGYSSRVGVAHGLMHVSVLRSPSRTARRRWETAATALVYFVSGPSEFVDVTNSRWEHQHPRPDDARGFRDGRPGCAGRRVGALLHGGVRGDAAHRVRRGVEVALGTVPARRYSWTSTLRARPSLRRAHPRARRARGRARLRAVGTTGSSRFRFRRFPFFHDARIRRREMARFRSDADDDTFAETS